MAKVTVKNTKTSTGKAPAKPGKSPAGKSAASKSAGGRGYEFIICEKPSTMEKIAQALADGKPVRKTDSGVGYYELSHNHKDIVVASAVGHLYTVAEKEKSFAYPSFDVEWVLSADVDKSSAHSRKYANVIRKLAKDAREFTIATDYDIEGETIGLNIIKYLCRQKDANRMKFSTVTADDLREAYVEKHSTLDWGQANAGTTRHVLDWFYGINMSRALTTAVKTAGSFMILSTGRVQGPTLKIVVERELEIKAFVPQDFWQIEIKGEHMGMPWAALHEKDRFGNEEEAKAIVKKCKERPAKVEAIDSKRFNQGAPFPFDLGTLQTEAYRAFGINPKDTLAVAQHLYTNAYISYPRTSSQKLPPKIGYRKILGALAKSDSYRQSAERLLAKSLLTPAEGKKDDPAHPAIFPTGDIPSHLGGREQKVYDLIVRRFLATFGEDAVRETNTVTIVIAGERFLLRGTRTIEKGWHVLYAPYVDLKDEELPPFAKGQDVSYTQLHTLKKQTQPPRRYTPASLVSELEKRGLGTKATRAEIVDSLVKRNYVKGQRSFEATELGIKICEILEKAVPEIVDEALTQHFEEELEQIREGEKRGDEVIDEAKDELTKILSKFKKGERKTGEGLIEARQIERDIQDTLFACPLCKEGTLRIKFSPKTKSRFIGCDKYPDCTFTAPLTRGGMPKPADKNCESCGSPMLMTIMKGRPPRVECINPACPERMKVNIAQMKMAESHGEGQLCAVCKQGHMKLRNGRFGMFLGCDRYPACKTIINIPKSKEEHVELEKQKLLAKDAGEGKPCPKCGEGVLKLRQSARGMFLGCSRYPQCKTVVQINGKEETGKTEEKS
jgi:DNA topoisomerase-1